MIGTWLTATGIAVGNSLLKDAGLVSLSHFCKPYGYILHLVFQNVAFVIEETFYVD